MATSNHSYYHYTTTQAHLNTSGSVSVALYTADQNLFYGFYDSENNFVLIQSGDTQTGDTGLQFQIATAGDQGEMVGDYPPYPPLPSVEEATTQDSYILYGWNGQHLAPDGNYYQDTVVNFPIFDNEEDIVNYLTTGDDSNALNYDELHGTKIDLYCTNNGDRISFKVKAQDETSKVYLFDYAEIIINDQFVEPIISVIGKFELGLGELDISWSELLIKNISKIRCIIHGYYKNAEVFTFNTILTKKLLGLGSISCNPMNDSNNGYNIHWATDNAFDDITTPSDDGSNASDNPNDGSAFTGFSNLCQTYKVTKQALADLGSYLWNQSIFSDIKLLNNSPLENIVSCHYMPCSIGGSNHKIAFGNLDTNVSGQLLNQNMIKVNVASFSVPLYNDGFLGLSPYTSFSLYLPFVGMVGSIDPKDVCGHTVTIDYVFDVVVGSFGVMVYTSKGGGKTLIFSSQGTCNVDVPLTASNRAQVQGAILQSGVSLVGDALGGDGLGVLGDVGKIASIQNHSSTFGSPSSMVGALSPTTCYYIVRTPITNLPSNFAHTKGYMCMATYQLSSLKGFTKLSSDVDLSGFNLTQSELNRLRGILTSGFYL